MARLWSGGGELNAGGGADVEWSELNANATTQSSVVRSGTYAFRFNTSAAAGSASIDWIITGNGLAQYVRFYLRIASAPAGLTTIAHLNDNGTKRVSIRLNADRTLELWSDNEGVQVGSDSSALALDTWYRIELMGDPVSAGNDIAEAKIDGTTFASSSTLTFGGDFGSFDIGIIDTATMDIYMDDIAYNNASGSFQASWPGEGEIIHLRPNAAGDNEDWGSGTDTTFAEVDEVTPDDITTYIANSSDEQISDFNLDATPAALAADDTINCVQVGVRFSGDSATNCDDFVLRIKASSGGTVEESTAFQPTSAAWRTNNTPGGGASGAYNYKLTLYDLPGASTTEWTKSELDTAQIGVRSTTFDSDNSRVSTLWLLVDHKPAAAPPAEGGSEYQQTIIGSGFLPFYA